MSVGEGKGPTMGRINAMRGPDRDVEDRIFEMLGDFKTPLQIIDALGLDVDAGYALIRKVIKERDTPNRIALRADIDRLAAVRF
jgi:DNA invertase Pin-like site-specific DNA recombinase